LAFPHRPQCVSAGWLSRHRECHEAIDFHSATERVILVYLTGNDYLESRFSPLLGISASVPMF
jgi:hypothetical protein